MAKSASSSPLPPPYTFAGSFGRLRSFNVHQWSLSCLSTSFFPAYSPFTTVIISCNCITNRKPKCYGMITYTTKTVRTQKLRLIPLPYNIFLVARSSFKTCQHDSRYPSSAIIVILDSPYFSLPSNQPTYHLHTFLQNRKKS